MFLEFNAENLADTAQEPLLMGKNKCVYLPISVGV